MPGIQLGSVYYTDNPQEWLPFTVITNNEITVNHFFRHHRSEYFEEVKETTKPRWKVGDPVVKLPWKPVKYPNEITYMRIQGIENGTLHTQTWEFSYDWLYESSYRDPTPEELYTYFR